MLKQKQIKEDYDTKEAFETLQNLNDNAKAFFNNMNGAFKDGQGRQIELVGGTGGEGGISDEEIVEIQDQIQQLYFENQRLKK